MTALRRQPFPPGWDDDRFRRLDELHAHQVRSAEPFGDGKTVWVAHDYPERPLAYGAWLCCCRSCHIAIRAAALQRPTTALVLRLRRRRTVVIGVIEAARVLDAWGCLEVLASAPDDTVLEIFVARGHARARRLNPVRAQPGT